MACTVAVEESISEHYNSQIRALMEIDPERYTELLHVSHALFSLCKLYVATWKNMKNVQEFIHFLAPNDISSLYYAHTYN